MSSQRWSIAHESSDQGALRYDSLEDAVKAAEQFVTPRNIRIISENGVRLTVEVAQILAKPQREEPQ